MSRKVEGRYRQVIEQMNRMRGTKFAVDIPSGRSATTGCILGCAFKADYTVTFQLKKIGLELSQGRTMAGRVIVPDIGISTDSICEDQEIVRTAGKDIYRKMLPDRPEDSNKGTYGRLLVIAGSKGMAGAAYLNAHAAYMIGAGLVRIYTSSDNREILQTLLPEAIVTTYEEYNKEEILAFEKDVLGIYLSGHPLESCRGIMEKTITARTSDFQPDEETNLPKVMDSQKVIIGGMITEKTIKYTKNNKVMAFLTVEDLVGTVEVVVFPRDYEKSQSLLNEDGKVFIQGRVSAEDDKASKLILEKIRSFDDVPRELWIQFDSRSDYSEKETQLLRDLQLSPGNSGVVIYLKDVKAMKKLPMNWQVQIQEPWLSQMSKKYGKTNVKVVERGLKKF